MAKNKNVEISLEEKLKKALIPVDEQPYTIPSNWVWVGLKYISKKIFAGGDKPENFSKMKTDKNIFPIFSNGIDKDGLYGYTDEAKVLEKALTISARGTIGFTKIREANFTPIIRLIVIILKDRILYKFLDYYFKYNSLEGVGSSIPQLTVPIVNEKIIPLPPLNEQKRIVEKLDFLFEKTKRAKEIIEEIKIDIENRKISILDRAFKGTLTSKWRNDNKTSDVKELLKTINDEKIKKWEEDCLQAEKDGNKKPKKPIIKEVKDMIVPVDEQPYKLPDSWVWVRLEDVVTLDNGEIIENEELVYFDVKTLRVNVEFEKKNSGRLVEKNDLVILVDGENSGEIFKIPYRGYMGSTFKKLNYKKEQMWEYISIFLRKNKEVFKNNKIGSAIPHLNKTLFKEIEFPLPPLNEQKRIVEKLDFLFDKTKKAKEIIEEIKIDIENRKISILDRAFKGVLTSKWRNKNKVSDAKELLKLINDEKIKKWEEDCLQAEKNGNKKPKKPIIREIEDMIVPVDEQPYKLPDSWVWVKLGDIGKITSGGTPTSNEKSYYGGDIIWITPADMSKQQSSPWFSNSSKKITNLGLQKSSAQLIEGNSVVYSSRAPIGYVNIVKDKFTTSQGCKSVTPIKNSLMYIYYVLMERTEDIKYRASGTTFKEISALEFGKTLVPLPPLEEQQEIVRVLDEVLENENKVKELLELEERIDVLEKSILHKAFKGELGTQNSSDEHALELLKEIL